MLSFSFLEEYCNSRSTVIKDCTLMTHKLLMLSVSSLIKPEEKEQLLHRLVVKILSQALRFNKCFVKSLFSPFFLPPPPPFPTISAFQTCHTYRKMFLLSCHKNHLRLSQCLAQFPFGSKQSINGNYFYYHLIFSFVQENKLKKSIKFGERMFKINKNL